MSARLRSRLWLLVVVRLMIPLLPAVSLPKQVVAGAASLLPETVAMPQAHETPIVLTAPIAPMPAHHDQTKVDDSPQFVVVEPGMEPASVTPTPLRRLCQSSLRNRCRSRRSRIRSTGDESFCSPGLPVRWCCLPGSLSQPSGSRARSDCSTRLPIRKSLSLLASCCELFGISRTPQLLAGGEGSAPALIGVIHPKVLLPATLASQLTLDEIRLIFLHELAHLRRHDVLLNYLFAILIALHWFNPLLWIAGYQMAADRELACDEAVLRVTSRRHARMYGCTLLKLVELLNFQRLPAGAVGVVQSKTLIQRRIDMIASYPSRTPRSSLFVRCAAMSLALAAVCARDTRLRAAGSVPAAPSAPSALPAAAPSPSPSVSPGSAPSAMPAPPAAPAAPFGGSAPAALPPPPAPVGAAPPSASLPPAVDPTAPVAPAAGAALPEPARAEQIAEVSPELRRLIDRAVQARSTVEQLKQQGLMSA